MRAALLQWHHWPPEGRKAHAPELVRVRGEHDAGRARRGAGPRRRLCPCRPDHPYERAVRAAVPRRRCATDRAAVVGSAHLRRSRGRARRHAHGDRADDGGAPADTARGGPLDVRRPADARLCGSAHAARADATGLRADHAPSRAVLRPGRGHPAGYRPGRPGPCAGPGGRARAAELGRTQRPRRRGARRGRGGPTGCPRRTGGGRHARRSRDGRLLERAEPRRPVEVGRRRLAAHRRPRSGQRRRSSVADRPLGRHDHLRRLQHLSP